MDYGTNNVQLQLNRPQFTTGICEYYQFRDYESGRVPEYDKKIRRQNKGEKYNSNLSGGDFPNSTGRAKSFTNYHMTILYVNQTLTLTSCLI